MLRNHFHKVLLVRLLPSFPLGVDGSITFSSMLRQTASALHFSLTGLVFPILLGWIYAETWHRGVINLFSASVIYYLWRCALHHGKSQTTTNPLGEVITNNNKCVLAALDQANSHQPDRS